ncbi:hypothetical protein D1822_00775 [Phaeobacter inhibens]|uniref:hypothetical protein n=1 Tax=Phaeobacter inhibens TaxID=221822 RepID=UPI00016332EC|nr:hypothetical protein [Phaeobacter inhibens]AFO89901.1 hypothetical protein PGA1_c01580 [Phaeobacter inhibens DSM 17395]AUQ44529.1 hypothetical protein PhaeoP10_00157 [Phaeobacter inhibens]AXT21452.1 hypothetical protein D1822_00775 [Phaeobacter inhibens]
MSLTIADIGTLVAAVAAVLSFVWAIVLWKRQKVHEELQEFRKDLSDFRGALVLFCDYVGDTSAIEAGNLSAFRLLEMAHTREPIDLKSFLRRCDKTEVIMGSIIFGHQKSGLCQEKKTTLAGIQMSAGKHNEAFPITALLLGTVSAFLGRTIDINVPLRVFDESKEAFEKLLEQIEDDLDEGMLFSVLSDYFTQLGGHGSPQNARSILLVRQLVELIISNYLTRTDRQLLQASRHEKRFRSKGLELTSTYNGDITKLSEAYEKMLVNSDWTALVEQRTKLNEVYS